MPSWWGKRVSVFFRMAFLEAATETAVSPGLYVGSHLLLCTT